MKFPRHLLHCLLFAALFSAGTLYAQSDPGIDTTPDSSTSITNTTTCVSPCTCPPGTTTATSDGTTVTCSTTCSTTDCGTVQGPDGSTVTQGAIGFTGCPAKDQASKGKPLPNPLPGISTAELDLFCAAVGRFQDIDSVSGVIPPGANNQCTPKDHGHNQTSSTIGCNETGAGLGPRFNGNSCAMCHIFPVVLAASPSHNPEVDVATLDGAQNSLTSLSQFINANSAIKEVRFINDLATGKSDGNVHNLFVITGRVDASNANNINGGVTTCGLRQPDFATNLANNNIIFRIPLQTQGDGLAELIGDDNLEDNHEFLTPAMGVSGFFNVSGNDASFTRFGWKAQNKSLQMISGEAYNVEQGVSNELFTNEREIDNEILGQDINDCLFNPLPDDTINTANNFNTNSPASDFSSDVVNFAEASRLSAPPPRRITRFSAASLNNGQQVFNRIGCNLCHSDNATYLRTIAKSSLPSNQGNKFVSIFSDLAVHDMGTGLADGVTQGLATGRHFRSAPLWGLSRRIFLLHDGRTTDLTNAIQSHASNGSEANTVINNFNLLSPQDRQDLLNFLRSL
jgi:hypothetical protein